MSALEEKISGPKRQLEKTDNGIVYILEQLQLDYPALDVTWFKDLIDETPIEYLFRGEPFGYGKTPRSDPRYHFINEKPYEYDSYLDYYSVLLSGDNPSLLSTDYVYKFTTYTYIDDAGNEMTYPRYIRNVSEYFEDENILHKYRKEMETDMDLRDAFIEFYNVIGYEVPGEQGVWIFRPENRKEISSTYVTAREALTMLISAGQQPTITPSMPQWMVTALMRATSNNVRVSQAAWDDIYKPRYAVSKLLFVLAQGNEEYESESIRSDDDYTESLQEKLDMLSISDLPASVSLCTKLYGVREYVTKK